MMTRAEAKAADKAGSHVVGKTAAKNASRFIPGVGTAIGAGFVAHDLHKGRLGSALNDGVGMLGTPGAIASTAVSAVGLDRAADKVLSLGSVKSSKYPGSSKLNKEGLTKKHEGVGKFGIVEKLMKDYKKLGKWGSLPALAMGAMMFSAISSMVKGVTKSAVNTKNKTDEADLSK